MATEPRPPDIPYPFPPSREPLPPVQPVAIPMVDVPGGPLREQLAEQRKILVSGPLELDAVGMLTAQLMAFDGASSRDVELVVNSHGGPLVEIFAALDVMQLMRARVNVTCIGSAAGTAAALVACGTGERRAARHARFSLRCDQRHRIEGTPTDVTREAGELAAVRERYLEVLVAATGRDEQLIAQEVDRGTRHDAAAAVELGIVDVVIGSDDDDQQS